MMKAYFFLCWDWRILKCLNRVHQWRDKNREPEKRMKFNWASAFSVSCHILWMKTRHISRHRFIFIYFDYYNNWTEKTFSFLRKFIFKCLNDFLSFSPAFHKTHRFIDMKNFWKMLSAIVNDHFYKEIYNHDNNVNHGIIRKYEV